MLRNLWTTKFVSAHKLNLWKVCGLWNSFCGIANFGISTHFCGKSDFILRRWNFTFCEIEIFQLALCEIFTLWKTCRLRSSFCGIRNFVGTSVRKFMGYEIRGCSQINFVESLWVVKSILCVDKLQLMLVDYFCRKIVIYKVHFAR